MQLSVISEYTTFPIFLLDVLTHALLSLYPLATKMLVEFNVKWVALFFFGLINISTGLLLMNMMNVLMMHSDTRQRIIHQKGEHFQKWQRRRMLIIFGGDILILLISLFFNQFGIYFYLLSPFLEFFDNYKKGRHFEEAINSGQNFRELIGKRYEK